MRRIYIALRHRARELGSIECRLWTPVRPSFLAEGGWAPEAMILIGRGDKAETDRSALDIPAVYVDVTPYDRKRRPAPEGWTTVANNEGQIGRMAADHLWKLGLRRFCLLNQGWIGIQRPRSGGFIDALAERKCTCDDLVELTSHRPFDESDGPGPLRIVEHLQQLPRPFGLFATSDAVAELAVDWCKLAGLRVPQDVAVLGAGDDPLYAPHANVPLSSVHLPYWEMGRHAIDQIVHVMASTGNAGAKALRSKLGDRLHPPQKSIKLSPIGVTERSSTAGAYTSDELVAGMIAKVREDQHCQITVDDLTWMLDVSAPTLYRRCRAALGVSPSRYIQQVRVNRSVRLLRDTDGSLAEVALRCGFSDQASFTRAFKRLTGATPGDFRTS
ncbi:MAG: helix-turn-helix domain-containing protein [Planctomycetota bacterium]|nr:helix-turn-helix domain-containing protein [Planctomycetota bacterium]